MSAEAADMSAEAADMSAEAAADLSAGAADMSIFGVEIKKENSINLSTTTKIVLCPFAVYYLRYAVRSFFTISRNSLVDGKRAGQKLQRKIAGAVQNVKAPLLFVPLF
jgi:hypothetical protein